jgi:cytochrome c-type biogenesis protein CcmE
MDGRRLKFVLIGTGIAAVMAFMLWVGTRDSNGGFAYYVNVHEYLQNGAPHGHFRINGKVLAGSIDRKADGQRVLFTLADVKDASVTLPVDYTGIIPDTFVDGADVVVEGRRLPNGTFEATTLLAKCPSKYEAAEGQQQASNR